MKYFMIDGKLISAENEKKAVKMYKAMFHKKPESIKEIPRPTI